MNMIKNLKKEKKIIEEVIEEKEQSENDDSVYEFVKAIALAALIALTIRSFLFEPFNIPSGSMFPTLLVGDYLFVEKYSYGYSRFSFPIAIPGFRGRIFEQMPERGDIAVFRHPVKADIDYIKRIIGLPGDVIQVRDGILNINSKPVMRDFRTSESEEDVVYKKYTETLPEGLKHFVYERSDDDYFDNTPEYKVPNGFYFVMGDNRDSSLDSRAQDQVGFIPAENLIGRAWFIFFSTEGGQSKCEKEGFLASERKYACKTYAWAKGIRYKRLLKVINKIQDDTNSRK